MFSRDVSQKQISDAAHFTSPVLPPRLALDKSNARRKATMLFIPSALLLTFALLFSKALCAPAPLPLIIWHGLGDNYASAGMSSIADLANQTHPGTYVYNIRLADSSSVDQRASFYGNVSAQVAQVCDALAAHPVLSRAPAVNALGFSQGGQFLRGLVQRCSGSNVPRVRRLVTFGSQHNGIVDYRACGRTDWVCRGAVALLKSNTWSDFVQDSVVPAQYYRPWSVAESGIGGGERADFGRAPPDAAYLDHSSYLADLNNERADKNPKYAARIAALDKFVMVVFDNDTTVLPKESGWFADVVVNGSSSASFSPSAFALSDDTGEQLITVPLRQRRLYTEDWLGLRLLDDKGGLEMRSVPGEHMQLSDKELVTVFKDFFGPVEIGGETSENWGATSSQERLEL